MEKGKIIILVLTVLVMFTATAMIATATEPPTPFHVYGWVKYSNGTAVLGPNVNITNLNTTENTTKNYTVETNASYSYYQVITSSCNVSASDMLNFSASDNGNSTDRTVTITPKNMTEGGMFEQNLTIQKGICGDVNRDGYVTGYDSDLILLYLYKGYSLEDEWAADVNADGYITGYDSDLILLYLYKGYELSCRP